jgi:hypothetical protein
MTRYVRLVRKWVLRKGDRLIEEVRELLLRDGLGKVLEKENFVRREILVRHLHVGTPCSERGRVTLAYL